ncbi:WXG100 family type VII secretion target [Streptomyces sp. NPDC001930]|uniref:WXG100 family type VII secretion target n=1 Tax=Streptomyces sp. NPDC001930 TaxID=3364625 RepID=UPI0036C645C6
MSRAHEGGGGGGGATDFQNMTHQQMLDWLDEASEPGVRLAGDRLTAAAEQLHQIADQLKTRTGRVDWKGEAEKAFTEWAESVVSSTRSLGDYSAHSAEWMHRTAQAIASAKSATPRYTSHESAKANLEAAQKYRNDPDSATVARNAQSAMSASEDLQAIIDKERANKQAAADEMRKLSSTYQWSSFQMTSVAPPTFPPPPGEFVPAQDDVRRGTTGVGSSPQSDRSTVTDTGTTHITRPQQQDTRTGTPDTNIVQPTDDPTRPTQPTHIVRPEVRPDVPVDLGIDSVDTKTPPTTLPGPTTQTPGTPPPITKPDGSAPPFVTTTGMPPLPSKGGPGTLPPTGPVTGGTRNPMNNTGPRGLPTGPGPLGGPREGISGGKAVPHAQGRPQTGLPRSTVIGTEPGRNGSGMGRAPMGGGMGGPMGSGMGGGQNGITGGRRLAGETGGVVGGKAQRASATGGGARPFTPGGSGLVRGGSTQQPGDREETNGERPDYLVEDEETWQQGRRVAPPVID